MSYLKLNDGARMPRLGLGLWQVPNAIAADTVRSAAALGYRLFDGAAIYGNEKELGQGIQSSGISRDQLFVTTKIWNDNHGFDAALRAFDSSVARLGITPDLILVHWPCPERRLYVQTWRALVRLREEGRVRSIGVSNFNADHLDQIIGETGVTPVLNQIELHPQLQQAALRAIHDRLGIVTQSWTPLGAGRSFDDPVIRSIANRLGTSSAQVILRWHIQIGCSAIPRSTRSEGQAENLAALEMELSDEDMAAIAGLDAGKRIGPDPTAFN